MFHHFHGSNHPVSQGSISAEQFGEILDWLAKTANLIGAHQWLSRAEARQLEPADVCLTFDDGLKSQSDIAGPVLNDRGMDAFFFVYSGPLEGVVEKLEVYRYVRNVLFNSVDEFYEEFEIRSSHAPEGDRVRAAIETFDPTVHYVPYTFYTDRDKLYRYLRDTVLSTEEHHAIMDGIVADHVTDFDQLRRLLWMTDDDVIELKQRGHAIGLHSYSHPTNLARLTASDQAQEFVRNKRHLERITNGGVTVMSHPCNSYSEETLRLLGSLGLRLGFRDNMEIGPFGDLEFPRTDHVDVLKAIKR
jgi:peptidoglycan/xylan/chitin deacetylase (PgdA/CDA1 family)